MYQETNMEGLWEDWQADMQSKIDSVTEPIKETIYDVTGLSPEQQKQLEKETQAHLSSQVEQEKTNFLRDLLGIKPPTGTTSTSPSIASQISDLNKSPVLAAIPGGIYTVGAVIGIGLYLVFKK